MAHVAVVCRPTAVPAAYWSNHGHHQPGGVTMLLWGEQHGIMHYDARTAAIHSSKKPFAQVLRPNTTVHADGLYFLEQVGLQNSR
jgi:hypothetical protein